MSGIFSSWWLVVRVDGLTTKRAIVWARDCQDARSNAFESSAQTIATNLTWRHLHALLDIHIPTTYDENAIADEGFIIRRGKNLYRVQP